MQNLVLHVSVAFAALFVSVGVSYALPDCPGEKSNNWDLCVGAHYYANGSRYIGEWKNGRRHGRGIEYDDDGVIDEVIYRNGITKKRQKVPYSLESFFIKSSFNKLSLEQRKVIQFNLKELGYYKYSIDGLYGKRTEGALVLFNTKNLDGAELQKSKNVLKLLNAALKLEEKSSMESQIVDAKLQDCNDVAEVRSSNNVNKKSSDIGENCVKNHTTEMPINNGTYTYSDGTKYIGEFRDGKKQGRGILIFGKQSQFTGDKYIGEFKNDKYNGQGIFTFSVNSKFSGDKYIGGFKDNKKNGYGIYTYADGSKYVGEYRNDKKSGHGSYTLADGSNYTGEWKEDQANGRGTFSYPDGKSYSGEYKNGKPYGKSTKNWLNGTSQEGIWRDDTFILK